MIAPCPHSDHCPLAPGVGVLPWAKADRQPRAATCHVQVRVVESAARRYLHRARRTDREWRAATEAFCYLLVQKLPLEQAPTVGDIGEVRLDGTLEPSSRDDRSSVPQRPQTCWRLSLVLITRNLALYQVAAQPVWARLLRTPRKRRGHVMVDLCLPDGQARSAVVTRAKSARDMYRRTRKARQGETWPVPKGIELGTDDNSGWVEMAGSAAKLHPHDNLDWVEMSDVTADAVGHDREREPAEPEPPHWAEERASQSPRLRWSRHE